MPVNPDIFVAPTVVPPKEAPPAAATAKGEPKTSPVVQERRRFSYTTDTGATIKEDNKPKESKPETSPVPEDVAKEGRRFLENYLEMIRGVQEEHPEVLNVPGHLYDKEIFNFLTTVKETTTNKVPSRDKNGNPIRTIDNKKVDGFLQEPKNWLQLANLMEDQAAREMFAIGVIATVRPPGGRDNIAQPLTQHLRDQGAVNAWWNDRATPFIKNFRLKNLFREGTVLNMQQSVDAFNVIANDADERAYMKALGIDTDDFVVNATGGLELASGRIPETIVQIRDNLQRSILEKLDTRRKLYESMGVAEKDLDATGEQFLYSYLTLGQQEKTGTKNSNRIRERFNPNNGGVQDVWGRNRGDALFCVPMGPHPLGATPEPDFNNLDITGNLKRFMDARRAVMLEDIRDSIREQIENQTSTDYLKAVTSRITERTETGTGAEKTTPAKTKLLSEARERKAKLEENMTDLTTKKTELEAKKAPLTNLKEKQRNVRDVEKKAHDSLNLDIAGGLGVSADAEITRLKNELNTGIGTQPGLLTQLESANSEWQTEYDRKYNELSTSRTAALTTRKGELAGTINTDEVAQMATRAADTLRKRVIDNLNRQIGEKQTKIGALEQLKTNYANAQKESNDEENKFISNSDVPKNLTEIISDYERFSNVTPPAVPTITDTQLENLTIDSLIPLATVPPYNIPNATLEQQKTLREILLKAKTEQAALGIESYEKSEPTEIDAYDNIIALAPAGGGINPDSLLVMSEKQLQSLIPPTRTDLLTQLSLARKEARKKLIIRYGTGIDQQARDIDQQTKDIDAKIATEQKTIEDPATDAKIKKEKEALETIKKLLVDSPNIYEHLDTIVMQRDKYLNQHPIPAIDTTFTASEKAVAAAPQGYFELMDFFFKYKAESDRDSAFKRTYEILPPEKLTEILFNSPELNLAAALPPPPAVVALDQIFNELNSKMNAGTLSSNQLVGPITDIIHRLRDEAIAM